MTSIGERMKEIREFTGLNQIKLAEKLGLQQGSYSGIESGSSGLSMKTAINIAKSYKNIDLHWLITGEGKMIRDITIKSSNIVGSVIGNNNNAEKHLLTEQEKKIIELEAQVKLLKELLASK